MIDLVVNGKARTAEDGATLDQFIQALGIDPRIVAVERNGQIVKRGTYHAVVLEAGDRLEIVRMVGGG
jgi:thiamine biosynthesis protein ThiS